MQRDNLQEMMIYPFNFYISVNKSAINDYKCAKIINSQNKTEKEVGNYNKENEGKDKLFKNESGEIENKIIEENRDINVIN